MSDTTDSSEFKLLKHVYDVAMGQNDLIEGILWQVRLWDGMDGEWTDIGPAQQPLEALRMLGFSLEETLAASIPTKKEKDLKASMDATLHPQMLRKEVAKEDVAKGSSAPHTPITSADVAELLSMLGFFMGDQARRSNLGRLLKAAIRNGLTIHGLDRAIDGNG